MRYLGIDTSNYTTSAALYDSETKTVVQKKMLLPVKSGQRDYGKAMPFFTIPYSYRKFCKACFRKVRGLLTASVFLFFRVGKKGLTCLAF